MGNTKLSVGLDRHTSRGSFRTLSFGRTSPSIHPTPSNDHPASGTSENAPPAAERPKTSPGSPSRLFKSKKYLDKVVRRDSGLAPSNSTARDSKSTLPADDQSATSLKPPLSLPNIQIDGEPLPTTSKTDQVRIGQVDEDQLLQLPSRDSTFQGIELDIPSGKLDLSSNKLEFSKRGSMFIGGRKANNTSGPSNQQLRVGNGRLQQNRSSSLNVPLGPTKTLSADEDLLSRKVRMLYEKGTDDSTAWDDGSPVVDQLQENEDAIETADSPLASMTDLTSIGSNTGRSVLIRRPSTIKREDQELAGGIEDWADVHEGDVDRYGFIVPRYNPPGSSSTGINQSSPEPQRLQRVSTSLQVASEAPRRRHTIRRAVSNAKSTHSTSGQGISRQFSRRSTRPSSQSSNHSSIGAPKSKLRFAANRLPHNKDRRAMDEAGDMLTLPPGLANIAEKEEGRLVVPGVRRKEIDRNDKWFKMARPVAKNSDGGGMQFEFDTNSPKLIERTWKGIPDRWRATAWHAFLTTSAKKRAGSVTDEDLIAIFHDFQAQSSPDDVQIDIDVPRTINSHIMFRRRYRGGQRLLFRVLHAMSLYFPETGYVQGMATLAATLLCYYDEENTFVMLVRLWQLRGLDQLYRSGFDGLMEALDEFEKKWLEGGEVGAKMTELGITPTAYGTRWYLTLFNYSIPFPAQLRVWDVFMLLGDSEQTGSPTNAAGNEGSMASSGGNLDVLHAASAALIAGTREILVESDFEGAMKVLTSWIPIKDEELFMRVAKAEWKVHRRKG